MSSCDLSRRPGMPFVIGVDRRECIGGFGDRREAKHALAVGQERAWPGVLHDDRFAAGQITQRPIADPRVLKSHIGRPGAAELAARALNVGWYVSGLAA